MGKKTVTIGLDPSLRSLGISDGTTHCKFETKPDNTLDQESDSIRRVDFLVSEVRKFIDDRAPSHEDKVLVAIESPSLNGVSGTGHLYETGFLMSALRRSLDEQSIRAIQVPPTSLKKFYCGNGAAGKKHSDNPKKPYYEPCMDCVTRDKWDRTFEKDAGRDKRDAFALCMYADAVSKGIITHVPSKRRGHEKAEKAERKRQRTARQSKVKA